MRYVSFVSILVATSAWGANVGPNGVDSAATNLDGTGVLLGQVELFGRSAKAGYASSNFSAPAAQRIYPTRTLITGGTEFGGRPRARADTVLVQREMEFWHSGVSE
jgi:hypothetical protein